MDYLLNFKHELVLLQVLVRRGQTERTACQWQSQVVLKPKTLNGNTVRCYSAENFCGYVILVVFVQDSELKRRMTEVTRPPRRTCSE